VKEGVVEYYEIAPPLPRGMRFDRVTGTISGLPEQRFPSFVRHTFEVFAYNAVGMSACQVSLEITSGKWNLVDIKICTLGGTCESSMAFEQQNSCDTSGSGPDSVRSLPSYRPSLLRNAADDVQKELSTQSCRISPPLAPWLARVCSGQEPSAIDWNVIVDKVAALLERFGECMKLSDPSSGTTAKTVKGMAVAALIPLLGLQDTGHNERRLLRTIEHCSKVHNSNTKSGPGCPRAPLAVSWKDAAPIGKALVYLRSDPASCPLPPATKLRHLENVLPDQEAAKPEIKQARKTAAKVNEEFSRLLPSWRVKLKESTPQARQEAMARWRGPLIAP